MTEFEGEGAEAPKRLSIHGARALVLEEREKNALFPRSEVMPEVDWEEWMPEFRPRTPDERPMNIVVDQARVDLVLDKLMTAYDANDFPYNLDSARVPQDERHMPPELERGTVQHAMFFWNVCYWMRGGTESTTAVRQMSKIYRDRPDLFDCNEIVNTTVHDIRRVIQDHGLGMDDGNARFWHVNARRMLDNFDGDPRLIFEGLVDGREGYDMLLGRIANKGGKGFYGFQKKMTSMIAYYFMAEGLVEKKTLPLPVDVHVTRVSLETEMVRVPDLPFKVDLVRQDDQLLDVLRDIYLDYAERHDVDWLELCNAVWLLSQVLCGNAPGNQMEKIKGADHLQGTATPLRSIPIDIHSFKHQKAFEATCRNCPVNDLCNYHVPAGKLYYKLGQLGILSVRHHNPFPKFWIPQEPDSLPITLFEHDGS
jgi:hypothetical protein